jgi:hypothetical protein
MKIKSPPAHSPSPTPLPHKGGPAEQCRLDGEHIKARHIAICVAALQDEHLEVVGFLLHTDIVCISGWASNAKIESMAADRFANAMIRLPLGQVGRGYVLAASYLWRRAP